MTTSVDVAMPDGDGDVLRASTLVPDAEPRDVIRAFTEPDVLRRWWGAGELTIDPEPGGRYVVEFPRLEQTMRGSLTELDPSRRIAFTWTWAHEPDAGARVVSVTAEHDRGGSRLILEHGPYPGDEAGRAEVAGHRDGWQYFLPGIAGALADARADAARRDA